MRCVNIILHSVGKCQAIVDWLWTFGYGKIVPCSFANSISPSSTSRK